MSRGGGWTERVKRLGEAYLAVLRAELGELASAVGRSGRALVRVVVLVAAAAGVVFWSLGLLLYFAVELLALRLPRWGAVGIVLGVFVLAAAGLLLAARAKVRTIENPAATVRRRFDDHQRWWQERVLDDEDSPAEPADDEGRR